MKENFDNKNILYLGIQLCSNLPDKIKRDIDYGGYLLVTQRRRFDKVSDNFQLRCFNSFLGSLIN